ncbi:MAG TPA: hypothetical protein DCM86_02640 [Verrucomicrobiales bacterium]|nr:hypothetical protein [Verrucomicrobiales bacterium]
MNQNSSKYFTGISALAVLLALAVFGAGCSTTGAGGQASEKTGAQLWGQNCGRCHNIRSPGMYSDAQWEVAVMHMRVRANLTGEEHRKILAFLKSAH